MTTPPLFDLRTTLPGSPHPLVAPTRAARAPRAAPRRSFAFP